MKKIIAIALVLIMVLSLSVAAFAAGTKTVYCKAPDDWTSCYVHAWGSSGDLTGGWPGAPATKDSSTGLWKYDVPAEATNVIFHNNAGTQTGDLVMPTDNKVKFDVAANAWSALDVDPIVVEQYYVAGTSSLCGEEWNAAGAANAMTKGSDGIWVKEYTNVAAGEHKFKITNGAWTSSWGDPTEAESNIVFTLTAAGKVTIKFNASTKVVTLIAGGETKEFNKTEGGEGEGTGTGTGEGTGTGTGEGTGTGTGEGTGTTDTSGNRTLTIKAPSAWSKVFIYTWEPNDLGDFPGSEVQKSGDVFKASIKKSMVNLVVSGEKADGTRQQTDNITLTTNGKDVTITIADDGKATVTYAGVKGKPAAEDPTTPLSVYRVVGNTDWLGNWNAASDNGRMHDMGNGVYRVNFDNVAPGTYEIKITKDGKWDNAYGTEDGQNYSFTVSEKCKITVDFTIKADGKHVIEVYGEGVSLGDVSMMSVVILMVLASVTAVVLVVNKKKFI